MRESQFSGTPQTGATYLFESWYLAREDVNIYNSMGTTRATFTRNATTWSVGGNDQYKLGPAIDRWVDPAAPGANARSVEVATSEGRVKVAVKATNLGSGRWRYDYAVMNLDFARAVTTGAEPNLRVISNLGLDSISIPVGSATLSDLVFSDGDLDTQNDWVGSIGGGNVTWSTTNAASALNCLSILPSNFRSEKCSGCASIVPASRREISSSELNSNSMAAVDASMLSIRVCVILICSGMWALARGEISARTTPRALLPPCRSSATILTASPSSRFRLARIARVG